MKRKNILFLTLFFLLFNAAISVVVHLNNEERIKLVLQRNLKTLKTHYEILLYTQKLIASTMFQSTVKLERVIDIISQANHETKKNKDKLRDELQNILKSKYSIAKQKGVFQYQFLLSTNESFLRMHKPSKYGDILTDVRDDFAYVQKMKKSIRGFTRGRTTHAFRNTFPLFDKNEQYIGAVEISFPSDSFQWYLNYISHIHTHFIINKKIFNSNTWDRDDIVLKYSKSAESNDYMVTLGSLHSVQRCVIQNRISLKPIRKDINAKIHKGKAFSEYAKYENRINVFSFFPIKNLKNETVAWLVSYVESPFIESTLQMAWVIRIIGFFISMIISYFIILQIRASNIIQERHHLLDDILNLTDNIMFVTDFKTISFSNNNFKNLFNIKNTKDFNLRYKHNILDLFLPRKGYLHKGLLGKNQTPIELFKVTPEEKRVVIIIDRYFKEKIFQINISKTNYSDDYLVSLSDITRMKEKEIRIEEKAYIDGLTGVYNRNKFDELLNKEIKNANKNRNVFSIAIIDIDKFKNFNDTYGHLMGDEILIMIADKLNKNVRKTDTFARWGGEEFVILFKETPIDPAYDVCKNLKDIIENLRHSTAGSVTVSFGLTQYKESESAENMFKRCDDALYLAKENGRNRIEIL